MATANITMQGYLSDVRDPNHTDAQIAATLRAQLTRSNWRVISLEVSSPLFLLTVQGSTSDNLVTVQRVFQNQTGARVTSIAFVNGSTSVPLPSGQTNTQTNAPSSSYVPVTVQVTGNNFASTIYGSANFANVIKNLLISNGIGVNSVTVGWNTNGLTGYYELIISINAREQDSNAALQELLVRTLSAQLSGISVTVTARGGSLLSNANTGGNGSANTGGNGSSQGSGDYISDLLTKVGTTLGASTGTAVMIGGLALVVGYIVLTRDK